MHFRNHGNNLMQYFLHLRMGHAPPKTIKHMFRNNMAKILSGITYGMIKDVHDIPCKHCELARGCSRIPVHVSENDKDKLLPMEVISSDIIGKFNLLSRRREHCITVYVDNFSGLIMTYFMKSKGELFQDVSGTCRLL
jgi:hypothetical protein